MTPQHLLLSLSAGMFLISTGSAQTAAPAAASAADAAAPAAASASASAPAASAPARGRRGPGGPAAPDAPPAAWDRPADGKPIFSEDFESGSLNDKVWTQHVNKPDATTIKVQQDSVAHGKYALQVHTPKGTSGAYAMVGVAVPESLRDHFYGRAYVSIHGIPAGHSVLMLAGSLGYQLSDFLEIGSSRGRFQPSFQLNKPLPPERPRGEKTYSQGTLPMGHWFCLEWEFFDKPDRIVIWVDGKLTSNEAIAYSIIKGEPPTTSGLTGGFYEFNLGFRAWAGALANDVDIYYDDVAIGDKPIGQLTPVVEKAAAAPAASTP